MSLFADQYPDLRWPLASDLTNGLRLPQAGALHAIAAHFSNRVTPGIVTMPTGSGKTAVLMATPFLLRATRVLVITPSRLVREQTAERFAQLDPLRTLGVIGRHLPLPKITEVRQRLGTESQWESLRAYDVVVGTPQSLSPAIEGVAKPPADLFDLVLVDEAHHSPARTWTELLGHFPDARRALFTATPFRADRLELKGEFLYTYDLGQAFHDGVFGTLEFLPVDVGPDDADRAIARQVETTFRDDRGRGLQHLVMVRTATKTRAHELDLLYSRDTGLRLKAITSSHTLSHVQTVIRQLRNGVLDGIICVDMLGEGFDLPELKIAALHSPHRSLAVTLQFVGRFARTNSPHIGRAAFVANVSEMEIEREKLFSETAIWGEIIPALSDARINREIETSRVLASFSTRGPRGRNADSAAFSDVSLHSLQPYQHPKIYALGDDASVDLAGALDVGPDTAVVYHRITTDGACIVVIVERHSLPEWTSNTLFAGMTYDLIVIYHDRKARLLFIHTSDRNDGFFESLAKRCITGRIRPISLSRLNKVLIGLVNPEFFNIGMRNRVLSSTTETYRIVTGSDAGRVVQQSDGRLYQRGHFFGRAEEDGERVTLGLSSMAKVWSNSYKRLPDLMAWFRKIADKLTSPETPQTFSGLDYLSTGREVNTLPPDIIAASWDRDVYDSGLELEWRSANETLSRAMLVDGDVRIAFDRSTADTIAVDIVFDNVEFQLTFSLKAERFFSPVTETVTALVMKGRQGISLLDFLNGQPLPFYTAEMSLLHGNDFYEQDSNALAVFDPATIDIVDWTSERVDIVAEYKGAGIGCRTIHQYLESVFQDSQSPLVFYDHGTGEIADFVSIDQHGDDEVRITLYHCKASDKKDAGRRVKDAYEVCGQAVKSMISTTRRQLRDTIRRRFRSRAGRSRFLAGKGDVALADALLGDGARWKTVVEMVIVQPGIAKSALSPPIANLLAATNDYLIRGGCAPLRVLGSA